METLEAKAEADPKRFIVEHFLLGKGAPIVVKTHRRWELREELEHRNLAHESVNAPPNPDGSRPQVDRWIVIGKDRSAVSEKIREISRETARARQQVQELKAERTRKLHGDLMATTKLSAKNKKWDVTGSWTISCPYMKEQWGQGDSDCSLDIIMTVSDGRKQMWAQFDFIAITGIFRFISPVPTDHRTGKQQSSKSGTSSRVKGGRAGQRGHGTGEFDVEEEDDEESSEEDEDDEDDESPTPDEFYLSKLDHPSSKHPTWNYRWRGEETGEGEIQLYSDKKLCSITFSGPGGTKLVGIFDSGITGRIDFTGVRTGATAGGGNPDSEWQNRSEQAYERARVGRWH